MGEKRESLFERFWGLPIDCEFSKNCTDVYKRCDTCKHNKVKSYYESREASEKEK